MQYTAEYQSPLGRIFMNADEVGLNGLWFECQKYFPDKFYTQKRLPVFETAKKWLDMYFSGEEPDITVPLHFIGTDFQLEVWKILCTIPYGKTITYGEIANQIAGQRGIRSMSAQAVGGAVGRNRISVIVPCHRVIGANGNMTGYAGGIDKKVKLLSIEGINAENKNR